MKQTVSKAVFLGRDTVAARGAATAPWARGSQPVAGAAQFTPRQLEVLALLCEGLPNKLICRRLNISTGTVKVHISCILRELGVNSRLQAVVAARSLHVCAALGAGTAGQPVEANAGMQSANGAGYTDAHPSPRFVVMV